MAPNNRDSDDDEMELINAEFESMVSGLNLDQSSPTTYLDDLDAIDAAGASEIYNPPRIRRGLHGSMEHMRKALSRWWNRNGNDDEDGAVV
jgi:hypothetical protein